MNSSDVPDPAAPDTCLWQTFDATLLQGYRTASGFNGNPYFPGGTLAMQEPFFKKLGVDLSPFYRGTLNAGISPLSYRVLKPRITLRNVKWHPIDPAEDFSFIDIRLLHGGKIFEGLVYYPHPETKPKHFQRADVLELLFPFIEGIHYGDTLHLQAPRTQLLVELPQQPN